MRKNKKEKNILLAIETSVEGGSISLLANGQEVGGWQGIGSISKAADILVELSSLLKKNIVEKKQISQIVISRGPGSFTGTRIGLAMATGLKKSLDCDICGVSVLEAMAEQSGWQNDVIAAVSVGTKIGMQKFRIGQKRELNKFEPPRLLTFELFIKKLEDDLESTFVLHRKLYKVVLDRFQTKNKLLKRIIDSGDNLAYLIGQKGKTRVASDNLQPIYLITSR